MFSKLFEEKPQLREITFVAILTAIIFLAILFLTASLAIGKSAGFWGQDYPDRTISVSGQGEVDSVPDVTVFSFDVQEEADSLNLAQEKVDKKMAAITKILKDNGIEDKDIKTTNKSGQPQYDWLPPEECNSRNCGSVQTLRNYRSTQSTQIKVRNGNDAGEILGLVGDQDVHRVSGLSFVFDETKDLEEEAVLLAIEDAKRKAKERAVLMEVKLGKIIDFYDHSDHGGYYPEPYMMEDSMMSVKAFGVAESAPSVATISQGESTVRKTIEVVFEIK